MLSLPLLHTGRDENNRNIEIKGSNDVAVLGTCFRQELLAVFILQRPVRSIGYWDIIAFVHLYRMHVNHGTQHDRK